MTKRWPAVQLKELLSPVSRPETLHAERQYSLLGAHWYGLGLYTKETKPGSQIQARVLYKVEAGDFVYNRLFAWKGSFALATAANNGCYVSNEFPCFRTNDRLESSFLWWYFKMSSSWIEALGLSAGGTPTSRNRLNEARFLAMRIPLPPLDSQRRIVARIEELRASIHEAIALRHEAKQEADVLWEHGAAEMFDHVVGSHSTRRIAELVTIHGGGTPSKSDPSYWQGHIPWISPKDMKSRELHDAIDHISRRATQETAAKLIEPGAVLVVVRGMILARTVPVAILHIPAAINQDIKALLPRKDLLPEFLAATFRAFNSRMLDLVEKSTHDTRKLATTKLLDIEIGVPPLQEQRRILTDLEALQEEVDALKDLQTETSVELDALLPSILSKAFAGDL